MKKLLFGIFILAPILLPAEEIDYFEISFEKLMQIEIFGSTLTPENLISVPSAVTVFSHQEIQRMGLDTLDELMNRVPGFQSYRSSGSPLHIPYSSRGRNIGGVGAEILVLVDGQRLQDPSSSGLAFLIPKFPLIQIKRIEFIRGPGAAVYGSNAMMGVINIITRTDVNEINVGLGSFNRQRVSLQTAQKFNDISVELFGQIETDDGDDYEVQDTFSANRIETSDPRKLANLAVKLRWQDSTLNFQHYQFDTDKFYSLGTLSDDFNMRKGQFSSISLKQDFNWDSLSSYLWLSYSHSDVRVYSQSFAPGALAAISSPSSNEALFAGADFDDNSETRLQWHTKWDRNKQSSLQFGIEFRHIQVPEIIAKNNFDFGDLASGNLPIRYYGTLQKTTKVQAKSNRSVVGVYSQYQYQLMESTDLTLGLRFDNFSNIGSQLSPRLGLVQEINDHQSLKLLYGEAFRAPTESELHLLNNPILLGNPDLKPETVQSWDLIWVGQWERTSISIGYFENRFKDSITFSSIGITNQYINAENDSTKGFEFELTQQLNKHWQLRGAYTQLIDKSTLAFRENDKLFSLMLNYQHGDWNTNLNIIWQEEREMSTGGSNNQRIVLDDYWQIFSKLSYNFNANWQGYVQVKNLLDEDYLTPAENSSLTEGIPNRGREILLGLTWQF